MSIIGLIMADITLRRIYIQKSNDFTTKKFLVSGSMGKPTSFSTFTSFCKILRSVVYTFVVAYCLMHN